MYLEGYSAWISIPGHELREFDVAVDQAKRRATCWIPSEAGMNFTVHWVDHGWTIPTATFIKLDGFTVPGHFLMGKGHATRSNVRSGITTVRPFTFAEIPEENANATPPNTNPAELGTIIVKIKRVEIVGKHQANAPQELRPPVAGRHSFGEKPIGIGFGREEMGHCQIPTTWKVKPYDRRNPGTYVTFVFRYRSRNFLISQGIMSETDPIHASVYENAAEEDDEAEDDSQYADSQYDDSQYTGSQYEGSQYAESAPPSPTATSPPGTPAPSVLSGPPTPGSTHSPNVRPPRRPLSSRSVSLGEPPSRPPSLPLTPPPRSGSARSSPGKPPHPLIPPHVLEERGNSGSRSPGARRVVSCDATKVGTHGRRPTSITSFVASSNTATYASGAVSYRELSHLSQDTSYDSSSEFSPTAESFSFSSCESFELDTAEERYHPNIVYSYDEPPVTIARTADPNGYLSSGYPGATDPDAREATAPAGPYDKSNVIVSHDGRPGMKKVVHHLGSAAPAPATREKEHEEPKVADGPSILSMAKESAKDPYKFPDVSAEALAWYANLPPKARPEYLKYYERPVEDKEIKLMPEDYVTPPAGSKERASSYSALSAPNSAGATRRPSASATMGPSAKALAAEAMRAAEEEARAHQARLDEARRRGFTPAVPIPRDLIFVDADGTVLPSPPPSRPTPPTRPSHLPTNRKASGEPVRH